jgi:hypothetical protein
MCIRVYQYYFFLCLNTKRPYNWYEAIKHAAVYKQHVFCLCFFAILINKAFLYRFTRLTLYLVPCTYVYVRAHHMHQNYQAMYSYLLRLSCYRSACYCSDY